MSPRDSHGKAAAAAAGVQPTTERATEAMIAVAHAAAAAAVAAAEGKKDVFVNSILANKQQIQFLKLKETAEQQARTIAERDEQLKARTSEIGQLKTIVTTLSTIKNVRLDVNTLLSPSNAGANAGGASPMITVTASTPVGSSLPIVLDAGNSIGDATALGGGGGGGGLRIDPSIAATPRMGGLTPANALNASVLLQELRDLREKVKRLEDENDELKTKRSVHP